MDLAKILPFISNETFGKPRIKSGMNQNGVYLEDKFFILMVYL